MIKSRLMVPFVAATLMSGLWIGSAQAQENQTQRTRGERPARQQAENRGGEKGERGGDRGGDFRQRMADRMKTTLGVTDEEWSVLEPKIEKVQTLQRDSRDGMPMMGGRGGRGGPQGAQGRRPGGAEGQEGAAEQGQRTAAGPQSAVAKANADLRTTLEDKAASADSIKTKLEALRAARTKAHQDLTQAQDDLRGLLNARQEAQLVMMGMLE